MLLFYKGHYKRLPRLSPHGMADLFVKLEEDPPYIEKRYVNKVKGRFLIFMLLL